VLLVAFGFTSSSLIYAGMRLRRYKSLSLAKLSHLESTLNSMKTVCIVPSFRLNSERFMLDDMKMTNISIIWPPKAVYCSHFFAPYGSMGSPSVLVTSVRPPLPSSTWNLNVWAKNHKTNTSTDAWISTLNFNSIAHVVRRLAWWNYSIEFIFFLVIFNDLCFILFCLY